MTVGEVHEDPRGKVSQGGQREHVFAVRAGHRVRVMRYPNREAAEAAREKIAKPAV